jgi:hypothetical protein
MARDWDQTLKDWAETIDETDEARGRAAAEAVRKAIATSRLGQRRVEVRVTGSSRNNTNIRRDSDIDVAVILRDVVFYVFPEDGSVTPEMLGIRVGDYSFATWRDDVGAALREHFGNGQVTDGDKAFNIRPSGARLDADVAVFLEHRRYTGKKKVTGEWDYNEGVEMRPRSDPGERIVNWPEQHYLRAVAKNDATNRRFKRMVRIFKHLATDMSEQGNAEQKSGAGQVSSFFLECLVYNAPDECFDVNAGGYVKATRDVLGWLGRATRPGADASGFVEVSGMERLFRAATRRTEAQAHAFVRAGWSRVFEEEALPW